MEQIVADLDLFLVIVGRVVDVVIALGLEEEVAGLAAGHRHAPGEQAGDRRVGEQQHISGEEGAGADEVQALVDQAVVVIAVVVPALFGELCTETGHRLQSSEAWSLAIRTSEK
ncbi:MULTISPECIES: hypothetical protein [unclassified Sphingomonas]|uniref:hypothetical protein n=1 Tax=unclassified Sphingomonas TaxID=196159 RepID=UPI00226AA18B|nr:MULTISPECIES: hypothetical protein [unclassified Sphingomonas]